MYVIMCNDYPQFVTADEQVAQLFCQSKRDANIEDGKWWHYKEAQLLY
jgi:hypothetical protein